MTYPTTKLRIKDMPMQERPLERLVSKGPASLSDSELLAIILRTGSRKENVLDISKRLFSKYDLHRLSRTELKQLMKNLGIGKVKSSQIIACFELSRRLASFKHRKKPKLTCAKDVAKIFLPEMSALKKEHFKGVYLNARMEIIKEETIFIGSLEASVVHPREIFQVALAESAASVILVHNHPSGSPQPSEEDITATKQLKAAGEALGIPVLDHIIVAKKDFFSFKEENYL